MTRYALLIGCDEYTNFCNICFCNSDVELMRSTLTDYCDYDNKNVEIVFQYKGCEDTPAVIYKKLQTLVENAENGDTILFYFAGHGAKEGEKGYLLLSDSTARDYNSSALDLSKINEILHDSKISGTIILDACHSGINARNIFAPLHIEQIQDTGCITLAACSENQESNPYPDKEQGVFTYFLCEEIKRKEFGEKILIEQLKIDVCNRVEAWARDNYKIQTPTLNGQSVGNIPFAIRNEVKYVFQEENSICYKRNNGRETIITNISNAVSLFGNNINQIMNASLSSESNIGIETVQYEDRKNLYSEIVQQWLESERSMREIRILEPDSEWRVFGEYYTYKAIDMNGNEWIIMLNILKKMNNASVMHAFKNLKSVCMYYKEFGKEYRYYQLVLIKKGNYVELNKVINSRPKIMSLFRNKSVINEVVYLKNGVLHKIIGNVHEG